MSRMSRIPSDAISLAAIRAIGGTGPEPASPSEVLPAQRQVIQIAKLMCFWYRQTSLFKQCL